MLDQLLVHIHSQVIELLVGCTKYILLLLGEVKDSGLSLGLVPLFFHLSLMLFLTEFLYFLNGHLQHLNTVLNHVDDLLGVNAVEVLPF
jgi:hypothetical protein